MNSSPHFEVKSKKIMKNIIRNEVEKVIKENKLNRTRIFEVSKQTYQSIIQKIEANFVLYQWNKSNIHWAGMGHFKSHLPCVFKTVYNNEQWFYSLFQIIPDPEKPVYVLMEDTKGYGAKYWLYEMYLPELITILDNIAYWDIYIISKKYDWLISENHEEIVTLVGDGLNLSVL